jgi:Bor protein
MTRKTIAALLLLSAGCYHASIESGMKPGTDKIEQEWASGWAWGLVGPAPIDAQSACKGGLSKVETEHSFLNGLVGTLTLGIYTPMHLTVTCASGPHAGAPNPADPKTPSVAVAR